MLPIVPLRRALQTASAALVTLLTMGAAVACASSSSSHTPAPVTTARLSPCADVPGFTCSPSPSHQATPVASSVSNLASTSTTSSRASQDVPPASGKARASSQSTSPAAAVSTTAAAPLASSRASQAAALASRCRPLTSSGTCYQPGDYCATEQYGVTGTGETGGQLTAVECEHDTGKLWHWVVVTSTQSESPSSGVELTSVVNLTRCLPRSPAGSCYKPGQFCPEPDANRVIAGQTGGKYDVIECEEYASGKYHWVQLAA